MGKRHLVGFAAAVLLSAPAGAVLIDDFAGPVAGQALSVTGIFNPVSDDSAVGVGGVLGLERDLMITRTGGLANFDVDVHVTSAGVYTHSQGAGATAAQGLSVVSWDGGDGDATTLDPEGLPNVDLTEGGAHTAIGIFVLFADAPSTITIDIFSDAGNASTLSLPVPIAPIPLTVIFPFLNFATLLGSGADFTDTGAIQITFDGSDATSAGLSMTVDRVETVSVPEPAAAGLLGLGLLGLAVGLPGLRAR